MSSHDEERLSAMNDAMEILDLYTMGTIPILSGRIPAVVFDIDDTLIDSHTGKGIYPMILLYNKIRRMGIPIFIITARPIMYLHTTRKELSDHGINGYEDLFMVDNDIRIISENPHMEEDKAMRKAKARKYIESEGYDILLNIGDDPGDMMYGHYIYGIKLPFLY